MECVVLKLFLNALALCDVAIDDDQLRDLPLSVPNGTGSRLKAEPRPIFVTHTVFEAPPDAGEPRLLRCFDHALAVLRMHLLKRSCRGQLLGRVAKNFLVRGAVVQPFARDFHERDQVCSVFADNTEKFALAAVMESLVCDVDIRQSN